MFLFFTEDDGLFFERTEELTTVEITTTEKKTQDYIGRYGCGDYNEYEDFYESEVNIIDVTDNVIIFDLNHYKLYGEDSIIATKNNDGYYYFEISQSIYACGYILLENNNVIIDITKSDETFLGKTTYHRVEINHNNATTTTRNNTDMTYYKSTCEKFVNSKDLVRFKEEYLNENFCYFGSIFDCDDDVYTIITDENLDGIYGDNIIYAKDCRASDKTRILEGDIVTIYCTFVGVSTNNRPCVRMYYADIEGLQQ
ncbi:MAG: hypothetical protein ACI4GB_07095 [Acutalibacteraceae bacterium]